MPTDQWKRANDRAKYGAAPRRESKGPTIKAFIVPRGTPCEVRKGGDYWRKYKTTRQSAFKAAKYGTQTEWVFQCGDWELKVERRLVLRKEI